MKNFQIILLTVICFCISYSLLQGWAQEWVYFAGELNEMFCFILTFTMGVMGLIGINWRQILSQKK